MFGKRGGLGARQQAEIVVDQLPVLPRWQVRAQRTQGRAGAAGKIDNPHRGKRFERGGDRVENARIARAQVVRLAQGQPVGEKAAHASLSSARAKISAECCQAGSRGAAARAALARRRRRSPSPLTRRTPCPTPKLPPEPTPS